MKKLLILSLFLLSPLAAIGCSESVPEPKIDTSDPSKVIDVMKEGMENLQNPEENKNK